MEKKSRQSNIQAVTQVLLVAFSQNYSENRSRSILKDTNFDSKGTMCKIEAKASMVAVKIMSIRKKPAFTQRQEERFLEDISGVN